MLYEEMDRVYQMIGEFRLKEFDHEMDPADYWGKLEIQLGKFVQDKGVLTKEEMGWEIIEKDLESVLNILSK
jgi:hypothetical protein